MSRSTSPTRTGWALGGLVFGATMMVLLGIWQVLIGIAAIVKGAFFLVNPNYVYEWGTTTWGWVHVIVGALVILVGLAIFTGAMWARVIGIFFAVLAAIANFFFMPYYPVWSIVAIALAVFVVWALATAPMVAGGGYDTRSVPR